TWLRARRPLRARPGRKSRSSGRWRGAGRHRDAESRHAPARIYAEPIEAKAFLRNRSYEVLRLDGRDGFSVFPRHDGQVPPLLSVPGMNAVLPATVGRGGVKDRTAMLFEQSVDPRVREVTQPNRIEIGPVGLLMFFEPFEKLRGDFSGDDDHAVGI